MKKLLFLGAFALSAEGSDFLSAKRDPDRDYSTYETRALQSPGFREITTGSALKNARIFSGAELPGATGWRGDALQERFVHLRDHRFLKDGQGNLRRSSWLYPDDGCYARAALAIRNMFALFVPLPSKVFAFGNLKVETPNSPRGAVYWWYHVAPIVDVDGQRFVLDPALEPTRPLTLAEWVGKMGNPDRIKVSICSSGTYSPGDRCNRESDGLEKQAERAQLPYLRAEERRLSQLGRESSELGELPPWD